MNAVVLKRAYLLPLLFALAAAVSFLCLSCCFLASPVCDVPFMDHPNNSNVQIHRHMLIACLLLSYYLLISC